MIDESTYGLNKPDAEAVIGMIGMADVEYEEMKPPSRAGAWCCLAQLSAAFSGTPATFTVDNVTALNYGSPVSSSSDTITVTNRYDWTAGADNAKIEIVYDPISDTWIPRQMECPA